MRDEWPDWRVSADNVGNLAKYVVTTEPPSMTISADLRRRWEHPTEARERARQLYNLLLERNIRYAVEPFAPGRLTPDGVVHQRIRTPEETLRGVGSCLDLSLLYAGMAIVADLRPLLAVRLDDEQWHALVLLDLHRPMSRSVTGNATAAGPDFWDRCDGQTGVHEPVTDRALALGSRWLAVDVVAATLDRIPGRTGFDAASERYRLLPAGQWLLVDIEAALAGGSAFAPPDDIAYPIHTQLPELRQFRDYPSRTALRREISECLKQARFLVLQGPGGRGKSMLAERLAWGADNGCGWVLNATDVDTLRASLAAAERAELGLTDEEGDRAERIDAFEVQQYALAALDRLRTAGVPWVVVLDNCDIPPDTPGLAPLLPRPRIDGQVVIITTREEKWLEHRTGRRWVRKPVPALTADDVAAIGLPPHVAGTRLVTNPLTAETVARLDADLSALSAEELNGEPHELIWTLVSDKLGAGSRPIRLAELLAWSPPEPLDITQAPIGTTADENGEAADMLVDLCFLAPSAQLMADPGSSDTLPDDHQSGVVQMHRLYAEAIRNVAWRAGVDEVVRTLATLARDGWTRANLVSAADRTMLEALERDHAPRVARESTDIRSIGQIWQGLGHVRERRGPVADSEPHFTKALERLKDDQDPYLVAEAEIGLARVVYQKERVAEYGEAQARVRRARGLLRSLQGLNARQLDEQGNALFWLIEQKLAGQQKAPAVRLDRLRAVREELWRSFDKRMQIWSGDEEQAVARESPPAEAGLGPERAYYNLAGVHIAIAKARFASGGREGVADDLAVADEVYEDVARLRSLRYGGRPHPHHAACVNGQAIVAYHQMAMLGDESMFLDACQFTISALRERWEVAQAGVDQTVRPIADKDVTKSMELLFKIATAGGMAPGEKPTSGTARAITLFATACEEMLGWRG